MQKSGYEESQCVDGVGDITGSGNPTIFGVGTGVEVGEGVAVGVSVGEAVDV